MMFHDDEAPRDEPHAPCDAYFAMAALLGEHYFHRPIKGPVSTVMIIGPDRVETTWQVPTILIAAIDMALRDRFPGVRGRVISR